MHDLITIDGNTLTVAEVVAVARDFVPVEVDQEAADLAARAREELERALDDGAVIYGVNTGFGKLANVRIDSGDLVELQRNLIRSHVAGVGEPLPSDVVRGLMLLRANVLLRATSGVRPVVARTLCAMLNHGITPFVPEQGSVGASGDLAPLSHVALAVMGEGDVVVLREGEALRSAADVALREAGIEPVEFGPKEGLSFINGTQAQASILSLLVHDSRRLWLNAIGTAAASLEALRGTPVAFDERIHSVRPHPGQVRAAELLRELLKHSEIRESHIENDP
ncbi:MAG: aromatic amino acid lyase, partial [Gemmatimonadales bacterium]